MLVPANELICYQLYHDCGKHLCLEVSEDGKRRFPNHAEISYNQFVKIFPNKPLAAELVKYDMTLHTLKGDELLDFIKAKFYLFPTLYFTAWSEIIANSEMFGGVDSVSFKIKKKHLMSVGKKALSICI